MQKRPAKRPTSEHDLTPTRTTAAAAADPGDPGRLQQQAHQICPGCGALMVDRGCKVRCLRCGFFLDCSDG